MDPMYTEYFIRLLVAVLLGVLIGLERVFKHRNAAAGMRTYGLVSMGAALFAITSHLAFILYYQNTQFNPAQIPAAIVTGVGFIGAGLMIWRDSQLVGLTSATGLWICAAIGMAAGYGLFPLAIFATVLALFVFAILWFIEIPIRKHFGSIENREEKEEV